MRSFGWVELRHLPRIQTDAVRTKTAHDAIDWRHRPEFLDTELQALGPDHHQGGRTVDKLVKVRRLDGADQWLFLHIEIQAQSTAQFPWRMWVYYYPLCDKYGPDVISLAILARRRSPLASAHL